MLAGGTSCSIEGRNVETAGTAQRRTRIALLQVDLQEGFANDLVIVRVNGTEVFRRAGVTTRLLLGYAEYFQVQVQQGSLDVEIVVPSRNLSRSASVRVSQESYLGVSIQDGEIEFSERDEPFSYA
jgi:hypothetical protein